MSLALFIVNSAYWVVLHAFLSSADFFQSQLFRKILSGIPSEYQTVLIQIRPYFLSALIWNQTVCKHYQQTTLVGKELNCSFFYQNRLIFVLTNFILILFHSECLNISWGFCHCAYNMCFREVVKQMVIDQGLYGPWLEKTCRMGVWEQQRRIPACAFAQSDQQLCYSLIGKYHIFTCNKRIFNILASLCSWGDRFDSHLVGNPRRQVLLHQRPYGCLPSWLGEVKWK